MGHRGRRLATRVVAKGHRAAGLSDPVAADWPELLRIVEERAKPERDVQTRTALRERWWQYAEKRPGLYRAIAGLDCVLAISRAGQQAALTFLPAGMIHAESTIAFPFTRCAAFCVLQARAHEMWACRFGSSTSGRTEGRCRRK